MNSRKKTIFIIVTVFSIFFQLANPLAAYADDGTPPPPDAAPTEVAPPQESADATNPEALPAETVESAPVVDPALAEEVVAAEEEIPVAEVIQELPAGTDIIAITVTGEVEPLTTSQAAEIIVTGDPIWCPDGAVPTAGVGGCSDPGVSNTNYDPTSLASLLKYLSANQPTQNGTIWIEDSYVSSVNDPASTGFMLNGAILPGWAQYSLTLRGGWSGVPGSTSVPGVSDFSAPIWILNWKNNVAVENVSIKNTATGNGLTIGTTGNISVLNSNFSGNAENGVNLITSGGSIALADSSFTSNKKYGAQLEAADVVKVKNVTASENGMNGLNIKTPKDVIASGANIFYYNHGGDGLNVLSGGNVTLNQITANNNLGFGAYVDNCYYDTSYVCQGTGNVTLTGANNVFNDNLNYGLYVYSRGEVSVENVTANSNDGGKGAYINNVNDSAAGASVFINGSNQFANNAYAGLHALSTGSITANGITAEGNLGEYGAYLDTCIYDSTTSTCAGFGNVTLTGMNAFNANASHGLYVESGGGINLENITADKSKYGKGAYLVSHRGSVYIGGTRNEFVGNALMGLYVYSADGIYANDINADGNFEDGAHLYANPTSSVGFSLSGVNSFNDNQLYGLYASSTGGAQLANVTANGNKSIGAYINAWYVNLSGESHFNANQGADGLVVESAYGINASNLEANGNSGNGAYLSAGGGESSITISGTNAFNGNLGSMGLVVKSAGGDITAENVTASDNASTGAYLSNAYWGNVTLTGTNVFENNPSKGLEINSPGVVLLEGVTANGNYYGVFINGSGQAALQGNGVSGSSNCIFLSTNVPAELTSGSISDNFVGIENLAGTNALSLTNVTFSGNLFDITDGPATVDCTPAPATPPVTPPDVSVPEFTPPVIFPAPSLAAVIVIPPGSYETEFDLDCANQLLYVVDLPNGDRVQIICPVSGKARISRVDSAALPGDLPTGFGYVAAFAVEIFQDGLPISFINEGGHINALFLSPPLEFGVNYSILYWDNGQWLPLKDFLLDASGAPRVFDLDADRFIISGLRFVVVDGIPRVEVSANFPGIFMLVQR